MLLGDCWTILWIILLLDDIGVAKSSNQGVTWKYVDRGLDKEWHLSYPQFFNGEEINPWKNYFDMTSFYFSVGSYNINFKCIIFHSFS
jgi:hypothetical protein